MQNAAKHWKRFSPRTQQRSPQLPPSNRVLRPFKEITKMSGIWYCSLFGAAKSTHDARRSRTSLFRFRCSGDEHSARNQSENIVSMVKAA
ncbi:hypothetical protein E2C01_031424 [Portunus trituberculatus]|uniref:Uncharacterized protein n=1 Tax=Portunus trituberculatus TaxID=210409 RepID=A0A5B7EY29_PORTR|nr:hypothetical protein [Portunus trituberculatus]